MLKGFIKGSKHINKVTKEPIAPTNLNVTAVMDTENNEIAQTNQVIEAPVTSVEMDTENNETAEKKMGFIKKLKVLIFDKKYISNLIGELKEINGKLLKNKSAKIYETRRKKLIEYNIRLENNTLLEVIYKNKKYNYNTSPLILAVKSNLTELAKAILSITGENLGIQDNEGMNVLHYAAKNNDKFIVDKLLQKKLQVDVEDKKGKTALHHAAENNCDSIVETLLQHGANINALDKDGRTPLFYALKKNHSTLATFMMTKGALLEIGDKDHNEETIINTEKNAKITHDYNGRYELLADTLLENKNIRDANTASEGEPLSDEQPTTSYSNKFFVDISPANENTLTKEKNPLHETVITNPASANVHDLRNNTPIESITMRREAKTQPTHDEKKSAVKHPWMPLRKVPKIQFPSKPHKANKDKWRYKTVILIASATAIITASMLMYFTKLPTPAIIGMAFASALVFGSITILKPMSKVDDTDCSKVCDDSKNLFV